MIARLRFRLLTFALVVSFAWSSGTPHAQDRQPQPNKAQLDRMRDNEHLTPEDVAHFPPALAEHLNLRPGWEGRNITGFSVAIEGRQILIATNEPTIGFASRAAIVVPYGNWRWTPLWLPSPTTTSLVSRDSFGPLSWNRETHVLDVDYCNDVIGRSPFQCFKSSYRISWGSAQLLRIEAGSADRKIWKAVWEKGQWLVPDK